MVQPVPGVLEIADLVKQLEEKWGVSAAAPVAVADGKPEGEAERLVWAMERSGWVQAKAARLLNITPRQMGYALQKYDIEVRKF